MMKIIAKVMAMPKETMDKDYIHGYGAPMAKVMMFRTPAK